MKEIIRVLKNNNITLAKGMSDFELEKIEKLYNIEFSQPQRIGSSNIMKIFFKIQLFGR